MRRLRRQRRIGGVGILLREMRRRRHAARGGFRVLRRRDGRRGQDDVSQVVGRAGDPLGLPFVARKELEHILELAGVLLFQESLGAPRLARVPGKLRPAAVVLALLAVDEGVPCLTYEGLMEEAVDDPRVHPVPLGHAGLEVASDVLDVALAGRVQGGAEPTGPILAFSQELDHLFGMGARFATVALLVMLVERIGPPEAAVATGFRTRILPPALVKLVFVALPVIFPLEAGLARRAPVNVLPARAGGSGGNVRAVEDRHGRGRGHGQGGH